MESMVLFKHMLQPTEERRHKPNKDKKLHWRHSTKTRWLQLQHLGSTTWGNCQSLYSRTNGWVRYWVTIVIKKGFLPLTIFLSSGFMTRYGVACLDGHPCDTYGENYYWCRSDFYFDEWTSNFWIWIGSHLQNWHRAPGVGLLLSWQTSHNIRRGVLHQLFSCTSSRKEIMLWNFELCFCLQSIFFFSHATTMCVVWEESPTTGAIPIPRKTGTIAHPGISWRDLSNFNKRCLWFSFPFRC